MIQEFHTFNRQRMLREFRELILVFKTGIVRYICAIGHINCASTLVVQYRHFLELLHVEFTILTRAVEYVIACRGDSNRYFQIFLLWGSIRNAVGRGCG